MARLVITDPSGKTQIFEIGGSTVNVGRAETNDLVLHHGSVSRHHARITVLPGDMVLLHDLGSMNKTYVNNQEVSEYTLKDHDRIAIGMYELKFEKSRSGDLHLESGSSTATDIKRLVEDEDISTSLRLTPPTAPMASIPPEERVKSLEKENNLLKLLLSVGKTLSSVLTPDEIMHRVMELVFQMDNVERGFVMLRDDKKGGFKPAVLLYKDEAQKAQGRGVALSTTVTEKLMNDRVPLLIYDVGTDERFSASQSLRISGIRSAMCAPLIYKDRVFGIFYVDCLSKTHAFSQEELGIFSVIAAEAAISFDNARSHEELARGMVQRQALERYLAPAVVERVISNPDLQLGGENQTVTILFSDIRGFTRMSEHMEPHAVVELLNEYFSEMTDIIFESGGTLDKYLGDGIMVLYGSPIPMPDAPLRAAKAAMEMQRALAGLNADWESRGQQPLRMGVGVNTGPVTAGNIGSAKRMDFTVIGDAVNLSSRLCSNAAAGQILISESTYLQLNGKIPARRLQPIMVKNKEKPVELYEVPWQDGVA